MKTFLSFMLAFVLVFTAFSSAVIAEASEKTAEEQMLEALGKTPENAKLDYVIDAPETYTAGDVITVSVSVRNITAESGIHVVEFALFYDNEKLLLTNDLDEDDNNALVCIKDLPNGWESFSRVNNDGGEASNDGTVLPLNDGKIIASVLTEKATDKFAVKDDDVLVFTFNFKVLDGAEGDLGFVIPHATAEGALNTEAGAEIYEAKGDFAVIERVYTAKEKMIKLLGEKPAEPKFEIDISAPEGYLAGQELTISVSVRNITAESGIHVVEFALFYDNEKLLLTNDLDEDDNNALVCIKDLPNGWESFSRVNNDGGEASNDGTVLPLNDGKIIASVLTEKATDKFAVKDDDVLVFTFNFKVLDGAEGDLGFVIPHATVDGALNTEAGAEIYEAEGDFAVLSKLEPVFVEAEEGVIEENAQLNVDTVESEDLEEVFPMIENIPSAIVFDIFIQKGDDRIQPNGELKISILAPVNVSAELRVYHIADDGKITDMNAVFENGYYTFTTTHLSYYMLANPDEMYKLGDVNNDGEIDKFDYIAVKRSVMNTITLNEIQQKAADVNISGDIEKFDYILIKRHVMGTYKIEG